MANKGYIYTLAVHFYAFRVAFGTILHCILHHFDLHLAPKHTAFSGKTHSILPLMTPKRALMAVF
jgi:hypothetical protein